MKILLIAFILKIAKFVLVNVNTNFAIFKMNAIKRIFIAFILKIAKFVLVNVNTMKLKNVIVEINLLVLVTIAQILKSVN